MRLTGGAPRDRVTVHFVIRSSSLKMFINKKYFRKKIYLDKSCMSQIRYISPDSSMVNVHEEIIVIYINCQLETFHQLMMSYKIVEESSSQIPYSITVFLPHLYLEDKNIFHELGKNVYCDLICDWLGRSMEESKAHF